MEELEVEIDFPADDEGELIPFHKPEEVQPDLKRPMEWAHEHVRLTRLKRDLDARLKKVNESIATVSGRMLEMIENEDLPPSFKASGASVYTRDEVWASAKDGDHEHLTEVLREVGLVEYLPSKVNSQSISAYVREHYDKETGEFDEDIDPRLLDALKVSVQTKVIVNG